MTVPAPINAASPPRPDRDFAALQAEALEDLRRLAPERWTDHNISDPGITLLEAALSSVADLHYRTANRRWSTWMLEAALHTSPSSRHPSGKALPSEFSRIEAIAAAFEGHHDTLADEVLTADSERAAVVAVRRTTDLDHRQALAAVRLLREPKVRRVALDDGDLSSLWPEEQAAVTSQRQRDRAWRSLRSRADAIRARVADAATFGAAQDVVADLTGLSGGDAAIAVGIAACPPGSSPEEHWELPGGATRYWPPHPLQARPVEPVTADDYAGLARSYHEVSRAWVVPGRLTGVGWDGRAIADDSSDPGAVTILVDPKDTTLRTDATRQQDFLVRVLRHALSGADEVSDTEAARDADPSLRAEVDDPYALFRADLDRLAPRRLLCDEVGAALITACPIVVRGTIHAPITADRAAVKGAAVERLETFLAAGREAGAPEAPPWCPESIDGPWPPPGEPEVGWVPGTSVNVAELVQVVADDPDVLGVEALQARTAGGTWQDEEVSLEPRCVPELQDECLVVELTLEVGG